MKFVGLHIVAVLAACLAASSALAAPAENARGQAAGRGPVQSAAGQPDPSAEAARRPPISMQAVIDILRRRTPGQQANVVLDGATYRVRWKADNGRLIDYVIDAQSGAIRSAQGE